MTMGVAVIRNLLEDTAVETPGAIARARDQKNSASLSCLLHFFPNQLNKCVCNLRVELFSRFGTNNT